MAKQRFTVKYFSQPNAWMTGEVLHDVLMKLNHRLSSCSRSKVLLWDNAGCHPHENTQIKISISPPKYHLTITTSRLRDNSEFQSAL